MDINITNHVFKKIVNLFWTKKCGFCKKIKLFKKLYICSCAIICHKKCHMKSMEKTEDNVLAAKCSVIKHDSVIGNKGDGLVIREKYHYLKTQVQNTSLDVNILQINP
jgi:hypothetical protein